MTNESGVGCVIVEVYYTINDKIIRINEMIIRKSRYDSIQSRLWTFMSLKIKRVKVRYLESEQCRPGQWRC